MDYLVLSGMVTILVIVVFYMVFRLAMQKRIRFGMGIGNSFMYLDTYNDGDDNRVTPPDTEVNEIQAAPLSTSGTNSTPH